MKRRKFFAAIAGVFVAPLGLFRRKKPDPKLIRGGQGCIKGLCFGIDYWCDCPDCETERALFPGRPGDIGDDDDKEGVMTAMAKDIAEYCEAFRSS